MTSLHPQLPSIRVGRHTVQCHHGYAVYGSSESYITFCSLCIQSLLSQSVVVGVFPYVGTPLSLMHQILIISLYAFEYRCYSQGTDQPDPSTSHYVTTSILGLANCKYRIAVIESNWPYFLGFGLPLTILIFLPNSYVVRYDINGCSILCVNHAPCLAPPPCPPVPVCSHYCFP